MAHSAGCWLSLLHLVSNSSDLQTDWIFCTLIYIIVQHPPSSCGRHKSHSFNPSTVKVIISWYSSTGCTCYLHRCISYFDSSAGSEVNIQYWSRIKETLNSNLWNSAQNWPCVISCSCRGINKDTFFVCMSHILTFYRLNIPHAI